MLFDKAKIYVEGGRGGNGVVSFRREAHVPRGGPDGGDGGRGGDVVLVCDEGRRDLSSLGRSRHFRGGRGTHGQGKRRQGERGAERRVVVPPGTVVHMLDGSTAELLADGQQLVVASGGAGGHGNKRFATSTRQAPRFAEKGLKGDSGWIELRLKLLADVGLVGLPNAGKSSLLATLTRADPKVASYPFTTIEPVLGTLDVDDRQVVLADIPGLIEGAAGGAGLGHEFLAHIERCRLLVHLVDVSTAEPGDGDRGGETEAARAYATIRDELAGYDASLNLLPEIVALSKSDLLPTERVEEIRAAWKQRLGGAVADVIAISSATGAGLDDLRRAISAVLPAADEAGAGAAPGRAWRGLATGGGAGGGPSQTGLAARGGPGGGPPDAVEHRVYRPGADEGFEVVPEGEGRWRITGRGIELLIARHDTSNPEALDYLEGRLREIGVIAELERSGFEPGDDVVIGDLEFELHPG
ncbi:MAG: Obg family GTPase CgtA [Solirubrobacterales bacterium]